MKITTYAFLALMTALPCVSRASIASKLNDLEDCRVAITNAIVAKGGAASGALTNAAAEIAALPSGSRERLFDYPQDWPVDQIKLAWSSADKSEYPNVIVCMIPNPTTIDITIPSYIWGPKIITTSDGTVYNTVGTHTHTFNTNSKWVWLTLQQGASGFYNFSVNKPFESPIGFIYGGAGSLVYSIPSSLKCFVVEVDETAPGYDSTVCASHTKISKSHNVNFGNSSGFTGAQTIDIGSWIDPGMRGNNLFLNSNVLREIRGSIGMKANSMANWFSGCTSLITAPQIDTTEISTGNYNLIRVFKNCKSMVSAPSIIHCENADDFREMFDGCSSLKTVPDTLDFSRAPASDNVANIFRGCEQLNDMPTHLSGPNGSFNYTISFADSPYLSRNSFAVITDGVITGGLAKNINDVSMSGYTRTLTLPATMQNKFTSEERAVILARLNSLGWTVGNFTL